MAAEALEVRMARLEGAYAQVDKRLALIETAIRDLRNELGGLRAEFQGEFGNLRGEMRQQFYSVIGLIVVTILVPIGLRFLNP